jgi:hypothetical protein
MPPKKKTKTKKKRKVKSRPPRLFLDKKGRIYIIINKKKIEIKPKSKSDDYTKRELLDIILKQKRVKRRRKKSKPKSKMTKTQKEKFEELEKLNRIQRVKNLREIETKLLNQIVEVNKQQNKIEQKLLPAPPKKRVPLLPQPPKTTFTPGEEFALLMNTLKQDNKTNKDILFKIAKDKNIKINIKNKNKSISLLELTKQVLKQYPNRIDLIKDLRKEGVRFNMVPPTKPKPKPKPKPELKEEKVEKEGKNTDDEMPLPFQGKSSSESESSSESGSSSSSESGSESEYSRFVRESEEAMDEEQADDESESQSGDGLYGNEIYNLMKDEPKFMGVIAKDEINLINPKKKKKFGFIINTDESNKPGRHWLAVYVDAKNDNSIEIYDPLGQKGYGMPDSVMLKGMKQLIAKMNIPVYLKMKINHIQRQDESSKLCGLHCMMFLKKRFRNLPWKLASGFKDLKEKEAQQLQNKVKEFGYL